jgi:hypothetical protein
VYGLSVFGLAGGLPYTECTQRRLLVVAVAIQSTPCSAGPGQLSADPGSADRSTLVLIVRVTRQRS